MIMIFDSKKVDHNGPERNHLYRTGNLGAYRDDNC